MSRTKFCLFLFAILSLTSLAYGAEYWLVMGQAEIWNDNQTMLVAKIDDHGNVLIPPTDVWQSTRFNDGAPSITNGPDGKLMILEIATINNPVLHPQKIRIARSIFTKDTLTPTSVGFIDINYFDGFDIQSSQKAANNVMVANPTGTNPMGYAFTASGAIGDPFRLIPRIKKFGINTWGVTSDGKFGYAQLGDGSTTNKVYVQPLNDMGLPSGLPAVGTKTPNGFSSVDISNPTAAGYRVLVDRDYVSGHGLVQTRLLDAATGAKLSAVRNIVVSDSFFVENLAIDPDGTFILYSEVGPDSCPPGHFYTGEIPSQNIWLQKLDGAARPVGDRVLVISCDAFTGGPGIFDIMKAD